MNAIVLTALGSDYYLRWVSARPAVVKDRSPSQGQLDNMGLRSVPVDQLIELPSGATLSLSNNFISSLPISMNKIYAEGMSLELAHNLLCSIFPSSDSLAQRFTKLNVAHNFIGWLPPSLPSSFYHHLQALNLSHNLLANDSGEEFLARVDL